MKALFNANNLKKLLKKGTQIGVLTANTMLFTGCPQPTDSKFQGPEQCDTEGCFGVKDHESEHDYCECEGIQQEGECGKCKEEGCVNEYHVGKEHEHAYKCVECGEVTDHTTAYHQANDNGTEGTYADYFKIDPIGDDYKVAWIDESKYNYNDVYITTSDGKIDGKVAANVLNDFQNQYKKYIKGFTFSEKFIKKYESNLDNIIFTDFNETNYVYGYDYLFNNISDACEVIFPAIIDNIITENTDYNKKSFFVYYRALKNEAYKKGFVESIQGYDYTSIYNREKGYVEDAWKSIHKKDENDTNPTTPFNIYNTDGTINTTVTSNLNTLINNAAQNMDVESSDIKNLINLSFTVETLTSLDKNNSSLLGHTCEGHYDSKTITDAICNQI